MKKISLNPFLLLFCVALAAGFLSCKKDDDKKTTEPPPPPAFSYAVNNVGDVNISSDAPKLVTYEVKLLTGNQQMVSLELSGLPAGIAASLSPASGIATFNTVAAYSVDAAVAPGTYPFVLKAKTAGLADKEFKANIIVSSPPVTECSKDYIGTFSISEECTVGKEDYESMVALDVSKTNRIRILNIYNLSPAVAVYADLDCSNRTLTVPNQVVDAYTVSGSGNLLANGFDLTYTISDGSVSNTCTARFRK